MIFFCEWIDFDVACIYLKSFLLIKVFSGIDKIYSKEILPHQIITFDNYSLFIDKSTNVAYRNCLPNQNQELQDLKNFTILINMVWN